MKPSHSRFNQKAYLGSFLCPIWVADIYYDTRVKPRLWGWLTFWIVSWYYENFSDHFPIMIEE